MSPTTGDVLIFDAQKLEAINVIEAHRSPLACITLNSEGTLLATASDKGTIIRVFSVPGGRKLYQFRRGTMPSRIYSMSFNTTSTLLCVSSSTDTIHLFKLNQQGPSSDGSSTHSPIGRDQSLGASPFGSVQDEDEFGGEGNPELSSRKHNGTLMGMIRRTSQNVGGVVAARVGGYLPKGVSEMWEPTRDFAWIKLPRANQGPGGSANTGPLRSVVAMSNNTPQVMVVTSDGNFYVFNIDLSKGGEGTLTKQYSWVLSLSCPRVRLMLISTQGCRFQRATGSDGEMKPGPSASELRVLFPSKRPTCPRNNQTLVVTDDFHIFGD